MIDNKAHEERIFNALILNEPFANLVKEGVKKIETRMKEFSFRGDVVICCDNGKSRNTPNAGKAICIVEIWKVRDMKNTDKEAACIDNAPGRKSYLLRNWRHFSTDFPFSKCAIKKNFQGIFSIRIPDDVEIIPMPDILPFPEPEDNIQPNSLFA